MRTLTVTSGPAEGQSFDIDREVVIGRENADLTVADPELSRRHAVVRPIDAGVEVEDLGSTNGTFVDGERIDPLAQLTANATIRVGETTLSVEISLPSVAAPDVTAPRAIPQDPDLTAPRAIPQEPDVTPPQAIPEQPDVTAPRGIPEQPDVTAPRGIPEQPDVTAPPGIPEQPDVTAPRGIPEQPDVTAPRGIPQEPDVTAPRAVPPAPPPDVTAARSAPPLPVPPRPAPGERPPTAPPPGAPPPAAKRRGPPVPLLIGVGLLALAVVAIVLLTAGGGTEKRTVDQTLQVGATTPGAATKSRVTLSGQVRGQPLGRGDVTVRETTTRARDGRPARIRATLVQRFDGGTARASFSGTLRRRGEGLRSEANGRFTGGTGDFEGAKGSFKATLSRPDRAEAVETIRLDGSIEY